VYPLRSTDLLAPGISAAFGALREPGAICDEDGLPRVEPLAMLLQRIGRQQRRTLRAPEAVGSDEVGGGDEIQPSTARWILLAATVDTAGACMLASVAPRARDEAAIYPDSELVSTRSYPRAGAAAAQCAFVVDIVHADGRVTVRRSPLARDAPAHLHYELLRVTHAAPISGLVVTLLLPDGGVAEMAAAAAVTVTGLRVAELRLPHQLLPPERLTAEPLLAEHAEAVLRADRRLAPAPGAAAAAAVQRGAVAELPLMPPLDMPPCAAGVRRGAVAGSGSLLGGGLLQTVFELASVAGVAALLLLLRRHFQRLLTIRPGKTE
jgi:hypothetical protein